MKKCLSSSFSLIFLLFFVLGELGRFDNSCFDSAVHNKTNAFTKILLKHSPLNKWEKCLYLGYSLSFLKNAFSSSKRCAFKYSAAKHFHSPSRFHMCIFNSGAPDSWNWAWGARKTTEHDAFSLCSTQILAKLQLKSRCNQFLTSWTMFEILLALEAVYRRKKANHLVTKMFVGNDFSSNGNNSAF